MNIWTTSEMHYYLFPKLASLEVSRICNKVVYKFNYNKIQ